MSFEVDCRAVGVGLRQPHYRHILDERPALGFLEVHSENFYGDGGAALAVLHEARAGYPISLHGVGLSLGSASGLDAWHLGRLERLVDRIDPLRVSDHASFARAGKAHMNDLLPIAFTGASLAVLAANVSRVQDRLKRPLLVENLSAYLRWADDCIAEPEFFNRLAGVTGCGLLLDLNNLVVNALNAGREPLAAARAFVDALAPGIVGEIHLAGYKDCGDIVIDDHGSRVRDAVWQLYRYTTRRLGVLPTLIEWDTDLPPCIVLLEEARQAARVQASAAQLSEAA